MGYDEITLVPLSRKTFKASKSQFLRFWAYFGVMVSFWKFRLLVTVTNLDDQGGKSKPEWRRLIWVVSQVIQTNGLAARAILVQECWNIFWFQGGFFKIRQLVPTSNLGQEGLIWSVLVSAPHIGPGQVSSLKNKLSRAILVVAILQSEGFWDQEQSKITMLNSPDFLPFLANAGKFCQEKNSKVSYVCTKPSCIGSLCSVADRWILQKPPQNQEN